VEPEHQERHAQSPGEQDRYWPVFRDTAETAPVRGNLEPDAHLVALVRQYDVSTISSHDRTSGASTASR